MEVIQNKSMVSVASGVPAFWVAAATLLKSSTLHPSLKSTLNTSLAFRTEPTKKKWVGSMPYPLYCVIAILNLSFREI
jgi:hypothetical protein